MLLLVGQVRAAPRAARASRSSTTAQVFGRPRSGRRRSTTPSALPEVLARAFAPRARGGPGRSCVALPEDMLDRPQPTSPTPSARPSRRPPGAARARAAARAARRGAERPLAIVGEGGWTARTGADVAAFAEATGIPVGRVFRCQDYVDNRSPVYAGPRRARDGPGAGAAHRARPTSCWRRRPPRRHPVATGGRCSSLRRPRQRLVHVHPDPDELGAGLPARARDRVGAARVRGRRAGARRRRAPSAAARWSRGAARSTRRNLRERPRAPGRPRSSREVMAVLRERLRADAILTCGAGQLHGLGAPLLRVPALPDPARAAQRLDGLRRSRRRWRRRRVAPRAPGRLPRRRRRLPHDAARSSRPPSRSELAVVVLVVNNGMYGTIRMHQERRYPGRVVGTDLVNPDFAAFARAFGAHGARRRAHGGLPGRARRGARLPAVPPLLELRVDPEAITPAPDAGRDPGGGAMSRTELRVAGLPEPFSHYTDAVRAGDLLFVSGLVPVDATGDLVGGDDVAAQAEQVFAIIGRVLAAAGGRAGRRGQGDGLRGRRRGPPEDQPRPPGVLRRRPPGQHARRGLRLASRGAARGRGGRPARRVTAAEVAAAVTSGGLGAEGRSRTR